MRTTSDCQPNVPGSREALIDAIEAHIARENLTRTGFGRDAVDDGSFLGRLDRSSDVRLETADKVLAFVGKEPMGPRFLRKIEAGLRVTRTKAHLFGSQALGDPTFVLRLERGPSPTPGYRRSRACLHGGRGAHGGARGGARRDRRGSSGGSGRCRRRGGDGDGR